ncbi:hypothetical protein LWI29_007875 [Acer saccharum]|uniref:N-acetyltransferase domain-containing protein n=1 Tax=Acer saccharum TaxID=4024 RepID=A0AA39VV12_ACESA|nr:hypothetical protein LWI29_007875 [Acer saccharum]
MGSVAYPSTFMELRWVTTRTKKDKNNINNPKELNLKPAATIPVYISTNPSDINPPELRELFTVCNHSCYRFPRLDPEEPVDVDKLRVALSHSCALVSLFSRPHDCFETDFDGDIESTELSDDGSKKVVPLLGNLMDRLMPVSPSNGKLVGFGRAVSDVGLTASIYDVVVIPSLRRLGIGQMIVRRIVRMLTSRDIYDISALCSEDERLFFEACGFGGDILNSTTMMYSKTVATHFGDDQTVKRADSCLSGLLFVGEKLTKACPTCFFRYKNFLSL